MANSHCTKRLVTHLMQHSKTREVNGDIGCSLNAQTPNPQFPSYTEPLPMYTGTMDLYTELHL